MATNMRMFDSSVSSVICTDPATPTSGSPVRVGFETGVALTNEATAVNDITGNAVGYTTVDFGNRRWRLNVGGTDGGPSAVVSGDTLFYNDAANPKINKNSAGYFFGFARGGAGNLVNAGGTGFIDVDHVRSPGSGTLGAGTVGNANLAAGAVQTSNVAANNITAALLTATLRTGFLPLPLEQARLIAAADIPAIAAAGGTVALNTDPVLSRVNAGVDKQTRLSWAAGSVVPVQWRINYPPDFDNTANATVCLLAAMSAANDTPVIGVTYLNNGVGAYVADVNAGGNTAAVTGVNLAKYTRAILAADLAAYPAVATIELIPAAHAADAIYVYGAWIEYTRK